LTGLEKWIELNSYKLKFINTTHDNKYLDDELVRFEFKSDGEGAGNTISTYAQIIPTMLEKMLDVNLNINIHVCL
jgi:hypothetical protein